MGEPQIIPYAKLPPAAELPPRMTLPLPSAPIPSYQPLILPSAAEIRKAKSQQTEDEKQAAPGKTTALPRQLPSPRVQIQPEIIDIPSQPAEVTEFTLPAMNVAVPVPSAEIVTTAAVTAGVAALASVGATMAAGPMFERLVKVLKPVMKSALKKIATARHLAPAESEARLRWRQRARTRHIGSNRV